jgi:hypothetical protein
MRYSILFAATLTLCTSLVLPVLAQAKPTPRPTANNAACPYLNSSKDGNTSSTEAVFDPASKTLRIQVTRSVPDMFWPVAESMTRERATKILEQCNTINRVQISFQSGQRLSVEREFTANR